jgi:hypothetical protein
MKTDRLTLEHVELAPKLLTEGRLYFSKRYGVALHLCCCGCGEKVVTPLSEAEWRLEVRDGHPSLYPSIGNWSMTCQSHYWVRNGRVLWAPAMSRSQTRAVFARDKRDLQELHRQTATDFGTRVDRWIGRMKHVWTKLFR